MHKTLCHQQPLQQLPIHQRQQQLRMSQSQVGHHGGRLLATPAAPTDTEQSHKSQAIPAGSEQTHGGPTMQTGGTAGAEMQQLMTKLPGIDPGTPTGPHVAITTEMIVVVAATGAPRGAWVGTETGGTTGERTLTE